MVTLYLWSLESKSAVVSPTTPALYAPAISACGCGEESKGDSAGEFTHPRTETLAVVIV
jgi:hypothetical protein